MDKERLFRYLNQKYYSKCEMASTLPLGMNPDEIWNTVLEGRLEKGQKVVVVEDLISTGGSVIEVVNALRDAGAEVLGIVSIFTYGIYTDEKIA